MKGNSTYSTYAMKTCLHWSLDAISTHMLHTGFPHVFDTVGSGCNMKDLLTPLHPCKTYQMAQNGGPFWLPCSPGFLGEMLSKGQPIIILSNTLHSFVITFQFQSYIHTHTCWGKTTSLHLLLQHMGLREEVGGQEEKASGWEGCLSLLGPCAYVLGCR